MRLEDVTMICASYEKFAVIKYATISTCTWLKITKYQEQEKNILKNFHPVRHKRSLSQKITSYMKVIDRPSGKFWGIDQHGIQWLHQVSHTECTLMLFPCKEQPLHFSSIPIQQNKPTNMFMSY